MTPDCSALLPNRRFLGPGMRKVFAGFLVMALAADPERIDDDIVSGKCVMPNPPMR
jgi:hypothetical protein